MTDGLGEEVVRGRVNVLSIVIWSEMWSALTRCAAPAARRRVREIRSGGAPRRPKRKKPPGGRRLLDEKATRPLR